MGSAKGSILIVVLFVMIVLSFTAVSFAYRAALHSRTVRHQALSAQLRAQAYSALDIALARLAANTNDFDHPAEPWCAHSPLALEGWLTEWSGDSRRAQPAFIADYQVIDEQGKRDVMSCSSEIFGQLGLSAEQVASVLDWLDEDDVAGAEGAEEPYYRRQSPSYSCKNSAMEQLAELLLIRGFTPADYRGEDADHDGQLDDGENDGARSQPMDNGDGELRPGLVDLLRCTGGSQINLNTAPEPVLRTLPVSEQAVEQILAYRRFDEHSGGQLDDHVFRSAEDIQQLQGLEPWEAGQLTGWAVYRSDRFRVFVHVQHPASSLDYRLEAVVVADPEGQAPTIVTLRIGR